MYTLALILVALVAVEHVYIMVLEMFLWRRERTLKTFNMTAQFAADTVPLAANQGLYNGFLAAGLFWGVTAGRTDVMTFFLICVVIAGLYGGATNSPRIALVQALPAGLALMALWIA